MQAAGTARLVVDGSSLVVGKPEVVSAAEAAQFLPAGVTRLLDWQGVSAYLRLDSIQQERD